MFNSKLKKEAEQHFEKEKLAHEIIVKRTADEIYKLYLLKLQAKSLVESFKARVILLGGRPDNLKTFDIQLQQAITICNSRIEQAKSLIEKTKNSVENFGFKVEMKNAEISGFLDGLLLGEDYVKSIITTFGSTSIGLTQSNNLVGNLVGTRVIGSVVGMGEVSLVNTIKGASNPARTIGWVGGLTFTIGETIISKFNNKKIAESYNKQVKTLKEQNEKINEINREVCKTFTLLKETLERFEYQIAQFGAFNKVSYEALTEVEKEELVIIYNVALSICELLNKEFEVRSSI